MDRVVLEGPIGQRIRIYRDRQGITQQALADLIGKSVSWLSQVERGVRAVDRLSVLIDIAQVLKTDVQTIAGTRLEYAPEADTDRASVDAIASALTAYPGLNADPAEPGSTLEDIERLTDEVHHRYQAADYTAAATILPRLITSADAAISTSSAKDLERALAGQHLVYIATAKLLTKIGDGHLAWIAAERAATAAIRLGEPVAKALAAYQVTCALLKLDRITDAERVAIDAAEAFTDDSPLGISAQGALFLIAAVIAGRNSDRAAAEDRLRRARYLADALGEDANHGWTAFGPTNVAIHQVSVAAELGDSDAAIRYAEQIDTNNLPEGLRSRRAQVHLDAAWAYAQQPNDAAVVINLLEAERVAPQMLRYNILAREIIRELLKREKRTGTPGLKALAIRAGVIR